MGLIAVETISRVIQTVKKCFGICFIFGIPMEVKIIRSVWLYIYICIYMNMYINITLPTNFPPFLGMTLTKLSLSHIAFSMTKNVP